MADGNNSKNTSMHKRLAMGQAVSGLKRGGAVKSAKEMPKGKKGNPFAKKGC